jgi:hypothetical protein
MFERCVCDPTTNWHRWFRESNVSGACCSPFVELKKLLVGDV